MPDLNASWRIAPPPVDPSQIVEILETDVVVIGFAHAGTAAARAAAEAGARVIAMDQQKQRLFHAVGNDLGHINSEFLAQHGIPRVDEIEFLNDWQLRSNNRSNPQLVRQFARESGPAFDWMIAPLSPEQREDISVTHWPVPREFTGDISGFHFYPGCARFGGSASLTTVAKLNQDIARSYGAQFLYECKAQQLIKTGNRVTGVVAKTPKGYIQVNAERGVILAAGDCAKNAEMVEDLCDEITSLKEPGQTIVASMRGQDGSGIQMGVWAGGRMSPSPIATMGANYFFPNQVIGTTAGLWLDRDGNRYCNEGFGDVVLSGVEGARLPDGYVISVFDSDLERWLRHQAPGHNAVWVDSDEEMDQIHFLMESARGAGAQGCSLNLRVPRKAKGTRSAPPEMEMSGNPGGPGGGPGGAPGGPGGAPGGPGGAPGEPNGFGGGPPGPRNDPNERMFCANTLEELADYMGLSGTVKANFLSSVDRYNHLCSVGRDDDFGKDPRLLLPICKPPYYAFRRHAQLGNEFLATVDGLWTDARQNVLDIKKEPIPGLYATGNCCGRRWGVQYSTPIPGVSIGMAWTLGRLCGQNAAEG